MSGAPELTVEEGKDGVLLRIRVQPRASREGLRMSEDGRLRVSVTAPPVDAAANTAVCAYLAKLLDVAKRDVAITAGEQSRNKTVRIANISATKVIERITEYI